MLVAKAAVTAGRRGGPARVLEDAVASATPGGAGRGTARVAARAKVAVRASARVETGRRVVLRVVQPAGRLAIGPAQIAVPVAMMTAPALARASPTVPMRVAFRVQRVSARNGRIAPMLCATLDGHAAIRRDVVPTHRRLD
jgi:hypothetical protein